ncbi:hypothetical protein SAMN05216354_1009 [Xylanibacter ruminicola]|jgi:hypothetical protein|uniref:Uncharacterized protein n=1 Tax=Xylanibacter ruminicola TaxID=839 RepID=A0A1H5TFM2_XYLRU|nr:hypothetical protein SAMN05216354_1009 [Xylanibacter ruminicola]SEW00022.1 hypothetical protein SAMN04487827_1163 [Prevotella sp. khp7]
MPEKALPELLNLEQRKALLWVSTDRKRVSRKETMGYITTSPGFHYDKLRVFSGKTTCFTFVEIVSKGGRDSLFEYKTTCFVPKDDALTSAKDCLLL